MAQPANKTLKAFTGHLFFKKNKDGKNVISFTRDTDYVNKILSQKVVDQPQSNEQVAKQEVKQ